MENSIRVYLGLGSNIGDREQTIVRAIAALSEEEAIEVGRVSHVMETEPVGCMEQTDYYNVVIEIITTLEPEELLESVKSVEKRLGREPQHAKWSSRTIDIDILFFGDKIIVTDSLVIPHPLVCERIFALKPMVELDPDFSHPVFNKPLKNIFKERERELTLYHSMDL